MNKKTISWLLVFSLIINISAIATFGYYRWFRSEKAPATDFSSKKRMPMFKKLGITKEQSQQMKVVRDSLFKEIEPLRIQLHNERNNLLELLNQDSTAVEQINERMDQICEIEKALKHKTIINLLKYRSILTDEQRDKFVRMMTNRMFGGRPGMKHGPRYLKHKAIPGKQ